MTLQEYKEQEGNEVYSNFDSSKRQAVDYFIQGFDKVLELDLPTKFANWMIIHTKEALNIVEPCRYYKNKLLTTKELYDYWLQNIYKL